jgi:hypothetical protein
MKDRFSSTELTALRNDLLQGGLIDSREAAELLQVFLMGRGYGYRLKQPWTPWAGLRCQGAPCPCCKKSWRTWRWSCSGR